MQFTVESLCTRVYSILCKTYVLECTVYHVKLPFCSLHCKVYVLHCIVYRVKLTLCSLDNTANVLRCTVWSVQMPLCSAQKWSQTTIHWGSWAFRCWCCICPPGLLYFCPCVTLYYSRHLWLYSNTTPVFADTSTKPPWLLPRLFWPLLKASEASPVFWLLK